MRFFFIFFVLFFLINIFLLYFDITKLLSPGFFNDRGIPYLNMKAYLFYKKRPGKLPGNRFSSGERMSCSVELIVFLRGGWVNNSFYFLNFIYGEISAFSMLPDRIFIIRFVNAIK